VAAGCCTDGQADKAGLVVLDQVGHKELLRMHLQDTRQAGSQYKQSAAGMYTRVVGVAHAQEHKGNGTLVDYRSRAQAANQLQLSKQTVKQCTPECSRPKARS
jgi:hypothetical protein